ncbi:response regulator transcription factor [Tsukamurella pseudospumae]|uniref:Two-component system response regulator n=1 Tax=Tsukamurella pseudospumae TaxID=239498 RepID=A0A138AC06_9ACTN|nr:response regulator transcription factor [Tsukamurella pseudospumae]KXP01047.1 two-component system response regulator [Tsukamurella pseudospumae]KXP07909.1 two-component system response regulator [Tsukamurella pseudospumae]
MRVLVVDDDPAIAETVRRTLVAQGWTAAVAVDGAAGFDEALAGEFDLIVLDVMMPGRNGFEVVRDLRRAEVWTPVLMLTAKDGDFDQVEALDFGADDYLTKPFSVAVLVARLRALARRGAPARPSVLMVGDLRLDPAAHTVHRGDTRIELAPREFALLAFLMRNAGTAVSKVRILESVWDVNYDGDENVVEVYIHHLRKRIDAAFGVRSIETVRGVGYRITSSGA